MRSKTFVRYIISYALVLILPFVSLFFFFNQAMNDRYSEELAASDSNMLYQLRDSLETELQQMFNLAYIIQNTSSLNPKNIGDDIMARRDAISLLSTYNSITTLPDTIIVYLSGDDVCYTGTTVITPEKLFGQQMVYSRHTEADFQRTVDERAGIIIWPKDEVHYFGAQSMECLTVFISVGAGNVKPKQRTVFVIPVKHLVDRVRALSGPDTLFYLIGEDGEVLLSGGDSAPDRDMLFSGRENGRVTLDGKEYFLSETSSRITGWRYTVLRPADALEGPVRTYRRNTALLLVSLLLLGGVIVYFFSWRSYRPIRKLAEKAREYAPGEDAGSDMEQVEAVLRSLSEESNSYRSRLENSADSLRQNCLTRLLADPGQAKELLEELKGYGSLMDDQTACRVAVVEKKTLLSSCSAESLIEDLLSISLEITDAVICENPPDSDLLALILQYGDDGTGDQEELMRFRAKLEEETGQPVSLGVSMNLPAADMAAAYRQAVSAYRMRLIHGKGAVVFYTQETGTPSSLKDYPLQELEALQWHLLQQDPDNARKCLRSIAEKLQREPVSFEMARMVCYDAVNVTIRTLMSMKDRTRTDTSEEMLESLIRFESIQELTARLENYIDETCSSACTLTKEENDEREEALRKYVQDNCFSSEFSLQMAADHFGLTPSNFSHYFKNCTGIGLSEYVQELRKKEACRMLSTTDEPIQEIGRKVGMTNVSSFIRSFKQQTGLTPGQYRTRYTEK